MSSALVSRIARILPFEPFETNLPMVLGTLLAVQLSAVFVGIGAIAWAIRDRDAIRSGLIPCTLVAYAGCYSLIIFLVFVRAAYWEYQTWDSKLLQQCRVAITNELVDSVFVFLAFVVLVSVACVIGLLRRAPCPPVGKAQ